MQERHKNREQYFEEQALTTRKFVIPFVEPFITLNEHSRILEIGCGEGGNLLPFAEMGCEIVGIDLSERKIDLAQEFFAERGFTGDNIQWITEDIYEIDPAELGQFDFIFLRDVIEHIPDQGKFMLHLQKFLAPEGKVFFGFPPWQMPFGGHQQTCTSVLSKVPYFHLLPNPAYKAILKAFGEEKKIPGLMANKETGISIERFDKIVEDTGYKVDRKQLYLINPNYETKFGLTPQEQLPILASLPIIRNFVTTCAYYVVGL